LRQLFFSGLAALSFWVCPLFKANGAFLDERLLQEKVMKSMIPVFLAAYLSLASSLLFAEPIHTLNHLEVACPLFKETARY
jgi:hypothetical protein